MRGTLRRPDILGLRLLAPRNPLLVTPPRVGKGPGTGKEALAQHLDGKGASQLVASASSADERADFPAKGGEGGRESALLWAQRKGYGTRRLAPGKARGVRLIVYLAL